MTMLYWHHKQVRGENKMINGKVYNSGLQEWTVLYSFSIDNFSYFYLNEWCVCIQYKT